jgi:hypothetical protein
MESQFAIKNRLLMPVWWCTGPGIFMVGRTARSGSDATPLLDLLVWVVGDVVKAEYSNKKQKKRKRGDILT